MGQKVHPIGIRLGVVKRHNANWYASPKQYAEYLLKDLQVREFLTKKLKSAMISNILIERPTGAARPARHRAQVSVEWLYPHRVD